MYEHLVAVHALVVDDPNVEMVATGHWRPDGSPVLQKASMRIEPGATFPTSSLGENVSDEIDRLLALGAARALTEAEMIALSGGGGING